MTSRDDSHLGAAYRRCAELTKQHGTTYYWSTRLLPAERQPHVFALYAFCRHADDIVDDVVVDDVAVDDRSDAAVDARADALAQLGEQLFTDLDRGRSDHPVIAALVDTTARFDIDPDCYRRFLRSMTMDLTVASYERYEDLLDYMDGSAAVIGEMMMPILGASDPAALAPARDLGLAFQLTNFLRDVGEDLDRGRVYLPEEDLRAFDVDPRGRRVDDSWRALMRFEIERTEELYRSADRGIEMLPPRSARSIRSARVLYSGILRVIEANDYDVFTRRARVSTARKLFTVGATLLRPAPSSEKWSVSRLRNRLGTTGARNP
jgi:phytoene synthase